MIILKKQLRQNLSKIQIDKAAIIQKEILKKIIQAINGIFVIFFIISNYDCQMSIITALAKMISNYLQRFQQFFIALSLMLIILSLTNLIFLIYISRKDEASLEKSSIKQNYPLVRKILPYLFLINELLTVPTLAIINNINNSHDYSQMGIKIMSLLCNSSLLMAIHILRLKIPYSIRIIIIISLPQMISSLISEVIAILITYYEVTSKRQYHLTYCLILTILILTLIGKYFSTNIGSLHLLLIIVTVIIVEILAFKSQQIGKTIQQENDLLLKATEKLKRDQNLSYEEIMNIFTIIELTKIRYDSLERGLFDSIINDSLLSKFDQILPKELKKDKLIQIVKFKIQLDIAVNNTNLQLKLQRYQLKIIENTLAIRQLYEIQKLSFQINKSSNYKQILRLQNCIKKAQKYCFRAESSIDCHLILQIDKQIEEFYNQVGKATEYYLQLWTNFLKKQLDQNQLDKLLKLLIKTQESSYKILRRLKDHKNLDFQSRIANFLYNIINSNSEGLFEQTSKVQRNKIKQSDYLVGNNDFIENSSLIVARRIMGKKQQLIGKKLSQILYDFQIQYFQQQLNKSGQDFEQSISSLVAFKVHGQKYKFVPFDTVFRVIPDPIQGIKFFFNLSAQNGHQKNFFIYCLQNDQIIGLSQSIFKKLKINEVITSPELFGGQLFNININNFINNKSILQTLPIKCQIHINNLRNKNRLVQKDPIDVELNIRQVYRAKGLNYIIFELKIQQQQVIATYKQNIKKYINQNKDFNLTNHDFSDKKIIFCRIPNPLAVIVDQKLTKISNQNGINYLKIAIILIIIMIIITIIMLLFVNIQSQKASKNIKDEMSIVSNTNDLVQQIYLLFYQYYQYYQVKIYPQQITQIQYYNMTAIQSEYLTKTNKNILALLVKLIYNQNPQKNKQIAFKFEAYEANESTEKLNFVNFLDKFKQALITNNPQFLIRNYRAVYAFIDSFILSSTNSIFNIKKSIQLDMIISIALLSIVLIVQKKIWMRICRFQQSLFQLYAKISVKDTKKNMQRAQQLVTLLQKNHYYSRQRQQNFLQTKFDLINRDETSLNDDCLNDSTKVSKDRISIKQKKSLIQIIVSKNLLLLIPLFFISFWMLFNNQLAIFLYESENIIDYSSEIQYSSLLIIQSATNFFQNAMEGLIPASQILSDDKLSTFTISTQIQIDLPQQFGDFKDIQRKMLNFDLCEYAYLNTGSLYKGIQCSEILDGMMKKSFTETYIFLLQKIQQNKGVSIQKLGKLYRPAARYPFYMEVCYSRRTISNMLAVIQTQFSTTVEQYLSLKQDKLKLFVVVGFLMIPLLILVSWIFVKQIQGECERAIKFFRILPRSFITRIEISKQLHKSGILQEIQLIAV